MDMRVVKGLVEFQRRAFGGGVLGAVGNHTPGSAGSGGIEGAVSSAMGFHVENEWRQV
jgi:hypothetical protein